MRRGLGGGGGAPRATDSTYGPIEDELIVNNPPIPEHVGPRLLRDNIPGVADEMRKWPSFFGDLELDLHLRSYYFNRELPLRPRPPSGPDTVIQEAWALGGWLDFQSGWLLDTFRVGATGYTSQPAYAPSDRDGTGLLGPGQSGLGVIGQAFAQLRYENYALLTGYRQLVNQGFVNPQDNRMIPNTFEGATLTGAFGPVEYYLGYLTAMKRRNADTFDNMATVAGVTTGQNRGLVLTSLNFTAAQGPASLAPLKGLEVYLGNYYVPDVFNTLYLNPEYRHDLTDDWRLRFGVQYFDQRSVGGELLGGFSTWQVGSRIEVGWRGLGVPGDDVGHRGRRRHSLAVRCLARLYLAARNRLQPGQREGLGNRRHLRLGRVDLRGLQGPRALDLAPLRRRLRHQGPSAGRPGGQATGARSLHRLSPPAAARVPFPLPQLHHPAGGQQSDLLRLPGHPGLRSAALLTACEAVGGPSSYEKGTQHDDDVTTDSDRLEGRVSLFRY